ncbi:MAG: HAMP domain-containing protein [Spirochaetaceae bacterium]
MRPLALMRDSAHRAAQGNYDLTIPTNGKDEKARLAGAFSQCSGNR